MAHVSPGLVFAGHAERPLVGSERGVGFHFRKNKLHAFNGLTRLKRVKALKGGFSRKSLYPQKHGTGPQPASAAIFSRMVNTPLSPLSPLSGYIIQRLKGVELKGVKG
jgi:hypothetical protein